MKTDEGVLLAQGDEPARGYDLLQRFRGLLQDRDLDALNEWLRDAEGINLPIFMSSANEVKADWDAVEAGLLLPWSIGKYQKSRSVERRN